MGAELDYIFYAIDKPLSREQRAAVSKLSRRASPTGRQVTFSYHVDGYDIPSGHEALLVKFYDVMVRCEYDVWTLGMSFPYSKELFDSLQLFACDGSEYTIIKVSVAKEKRGTRKQILVDVYFQIGDSYRLDLGAPEFPWERAEDDDEDDGHDEYGRGRDIFQQLAQVAAAIREKIIEKGDYLGLYLAWENLYDPDDNDTDRQFVPAKPKNYSKMPKFLKNWSNSIEPQSY